MDILNYLMVSDFNEGLSPDEFKFLLSKFRYYYRLTHGKNETIKTDLERLKEVIKEKEDIHKKIVDNLNSDNKKLKEKYQKLIDRKLSWKERIKGKIITKEDEINGI